MGKSHLAYLDVLSGMIPCKLLRFERSRHLANRGQLEAVIQFTADRGPYKRGATDKWPVPQVIPRDKVKISRRHGAFVHPYDWSDYGVEVPKE